MKLNPFDLTGGWFLLFYVLTFLMVLLVRRFSNRPAASSTLDSAQRNDPYLLAYLARGPVHAVNTTAFSLIERKLLKVQGQRITPARADATDFARRPLEKAIISCLAKGDVQATRMAEDGQVRKAADLYRPILEKAGLIAGPAALLNQKILGFLLALVFGVLGAAKIHIGLSRGHHNVIFLLILTIGAVVFFLATSRKRITPAGDSLLARASVSYKPLQSKSRKSSADSSLPAIAFQFALFGLAGLPASTYAWQKALIPENRHNTNTSSGCSSCSSGSSCSGGCGGGCGGCGG